MDRHTSLGIKKLFSLARTKIRLADEAGTTETIPAPLPLVRVLSGRDITTLSEAREYRDELLNSTDLSKPESVSSSVLQLMDIIEGVKYGFEPRECCLALSEERFKDIEASSRENSIPVNVLLMTKGNPPSGINLFIGDNPPANSIFLSRVPTSLAGFIHYAINSDYLSEGLELRHVVSVLGHRTLILNAVHFSLGWFGAELRDETD